MIKRTVDDTRGFSLVEILVVVAIMGVVMGAVYSLYITNLRSSYTTDEVSDMQMNLRLAMDSVARDLRMAGSLVDYQPNQALQPVLPIQATIPDNSGPSPAIPDPATGAANPGSDGITLNMASAAGIYGRINADFPAGTATFILSPKQQLTQTGDAESFQVNDIVRIIRPRDNSQPAGAPATFTVAGTTGGVGPTAQTITLNPAPPVDIRKADVIARANAYSPPTLLAPSPNTIRYAVISNAPAPSTLTTHPNCPVNQFCLARLMNGETDPNAGNGPRWEIVAQNVRNFQLRYVTSDNPTDIFNAAPADLSTVTAVLVTISGQTTTSVGLSGNVIKVRQLESYVKLINRRN